MTEAGLELLKLVGRRSELLAALVEAPREKRELEDQLDESRSTVDRALKDLEEARLVRWRGDAYEVTLAGRLQLQLYREFVERSAAVVDAVEFLGALPADARVGPGLLLDCSFVEPTDLGYYELAPTMARMLSAADEAVIALSGSMSPESLRKFVQEINDEGVRTEALLAPELVDVLEAEFPELLGGLAAGDCTVREAPVESFGLLYTPDEGEVAVGADDGAGTRLGILHNDTAEAAEWAEEYLADLRAGATDLTAEARRMARLAGDRETLRREGFVDLQRVQAREDASLPTGWRTGLDLAEVAAGLAVERERPTDEGRRPVADEVVERLQAGDDVAVLGPPGSGKSTTCKAVAWQWYEADRGPVLYRESGAGEPFSSWPLLAEVLRSAEGHALVVVEDAVRAQANDVFRVMAEFTDRDDVTVLLDAREHEWHDPPSFPADGRLETYRVESVETVRMPPLDEREVERFADRFEAATDATLGIDPGQLLSTIREASDDEAGPAALQLLLHRLALRAAPLVADDYRTPTTLVEDVRRAITAVQPLAEPGLAVAALANLLNAAGLAPTPAHLHAVGAPDDHGAVEAAIAELEGRVLFPEADGWRTVHESWSALFLETLQSELGEDHARDVVGTAMSGLLALADDEDRRASVADAVAAREADEEDEATADEQPDVDPPAVVARAGASPAEWAGETVEQLFRTALDYPGLAPLFGTAEDDPGVLPAALPSSRRADVVRWRARAYREAGEHDRAAAEYETLRDRAEEWASDRGPRLAGRAISGLGTVAYRRGDVEAAEERYREALAAAEARGDRDRVAANRKHLGNVAWVRGDLAAAEERYREALSTFRELDDCLGAAYVRHNLGNVLDARGDRSAADEHYRAALATYRELGKRSDEADCLNNLGVLAEKRGDLAAAAAHYRDCLQRYVELGDRVGEANALANLGLVAEKRAAPDDAETYARRALERYDAAGDRGGEAFARAVLGGAARQRGDLDAAADHLEASRELYGEVGDTRGRAAADARLARLQRDRGDHDAAAAAAGRVLDAADAADDDALAAAGELLLGDLARRGRDRAAAREHFETALSAAREGSDPRKGALAAAGLAELALEEDDPDAAAGHVRTAVETLADGVGEDADSDPGALLVAGCRRAGHLDALVEPLGALADAETPLAERLADLEGQLTRARAD